MGLVDKNFLKAFGKPTRKVGSSIQFTSTGSSGFWRLVSPVIGAGWYRKNFFYLFGDGLEPLRECLDAWSFIVPRCEDRVILGRNAYGAILTIENESQDLGGQRAGVIDPVT